MTDTPETDAFFFRTDIEWDDEVDFARKLERELDEANRELHKQLEKYDALFDEAEKIRMDRDTYLEAYSRLQLNLLSR